MRAQQVTVQAGERRAIWKYHLHSTLTKLEMPPGAEVLFVGVVGNEPYLWVLVDPITMRRESRAIYCTVTGAVFEFAKDARYYGTVLLDGGALVSHVFETRGDFSEKLPKQGG